MTIAIRYGKIKESGPTIEDHVKLVLEDFIQDVISDCRATPEAFPHDEPKPRAPTKRGKKRRPKTGLPYYRTGTLIRGLTFRYASKNSIAAGLIGYVIAPESRFVDQPLAIAKRLRDGFLEMVDMLHLERGVGWSRSQATVGKGLVDLIGKLGGGR